MTPDETRALIAALRGAAANARTYERRARDKGRGIEAANYEAEAELHELSADALEVLGAELEQVRGSADAWWAVYDKAETARQEAEGALERVRALFPDATDPCPPRTCTHVDCEVVNAVRVAPGGETDGE